MPDALWLRAAFLCTLAFAAGSIPFSLIVGLARGVDIRKHGSGNVGATNLGRVLGKKFFFLGFMLDMLKGLLPVLGAGWMLGTLGSRSPDLQPTLAWITSAAAPVLGHVFSPWIGFKGGKGVATGLGAMLGLYPIVTLGAVGGISVFLVVLACVRIMSVASMAGAAMLPIATLAALLFMKNHGDASITRSHAALLAACALLAMLVVWTHRANISRLRAGTEPRLAKKPPIVR